MGERPPDTVLNRACLKSLLGQKNREYFGFRPVPVPDLISHFPKFFGKKIGTPFSGLSISGIHSEFYDV